MKIHQMMRITIMTMIAILYIALSSPLYAEEECPNDPAIQTAAEKAVERLGPDRGALVLVHDIRKIEGLATGFQGRGLDLKSAIEDLKADVREKEIVVTLSADVLFDFDKASIKPEAEPQLSKLATILKEKKNSQTTIIGHTDAKGSDEYNQELSEKRAQSVAQWLESNAGIDRGILKTSGAGENEPIAPNTKEDGSDSPEGRAKNRRVEIIIQPK